MNDEQKEFLEELLPDELLSHYITAVTEVDKPLDYLSEGLAEQIVILLQQAIDEVGRGPFIAKGSGLVP